jgi:tetratricopeptide (TPR) repeat protein
MSLIVAKKQGAVIHIVSDTKLTYPDRLPIKPLAAPGDGVIKTTILSPQICIAFAGEVDPAEEAIKVCRGYGFMINEIKEYLLEVNKMTGANTEFILCVGFPEYSIYAIKNKEIVQSNFAWIGSNPAFSIFQEKALEEKTIKKTFDSILDDSMDHVLKSGLVTEVNGFRVSVSNEGNFFHYKNYMTTNIPARTYTSSDTNNGHIIEVYGTPEEGGYSVSFCENEGRNDVVAIHVRQGEFGVLYEIRNNGLLRPDVISNVDEHEFNDILQSRFGIVPQVAFSSRQKSYLNRGNKSFSNNDFNSAVKFYEMGLKQNEEFLKSALLFNKGLALLKLDRCNEACEEFDKAVKIDRKLEGLIQKVLFNR